MDAALDGFLGAGPAPIEDYGLIGDCTTAALVSRAGSVDWLCWPRFDSPACFAALLGTPENGTWRVAPADPEARVVRRYLDGSMVLETLFSTASGDVAITDFMAIGSPGTHLVRLIEGRRGRVDMRSVLRLRFDYGATVPWVTQLRETHGVQAIAGPNLVALRASVPLHGANLSTVADFSVEQGESASFVMSYGSSHERPPRPIDPRAALAETLRFWRRWHERARYRGHHRAAVERSLLTLKALTYHPTGGIVAAPTTSLPEQLGGVRNWDYRFCWLRDATLTLLAFMRAGFYEEAKAWRDWLHRSVAGSPHQIQIMYGIAGERHLREWEADWLPGYQGARPVRIGNAAHDQLQLDVYGEVMAALHTARSGGLVSAPASWDLQRNLIEHLETIWELPDEGIWETRGGRQKFTFSRVMAWVALDRAVRSVEAFALPGPVDRWRALRDEMHATICREGYDGPRNTFTQAFGSSALDASLLLLPIMGFLPHDDPRVRGTVAAIERELLDHGFVARYRTEGNVDGLPEGEGAFLACSFWLAMNYANQDRRAEAEALFQRLLDLRNDLGLLAEEYDPGAGRQVGNFPQAFSHISLIATAFELGTRPVETPPI